MIVQHLRLFRIQNHLKKILGLGLGLSIFNSAKIIHDSKNKNYSF